MYGGTLNQQSYAYDLRCIFVDYLCHWLAMEKEELEYHHRGDEFQPRFKRLEDAYLTCIPRMSFRFWLDHLAENGVSGQYWQLEPNTQHVQSQLSEIRAAALERQHVAH